MIIQNALVYTPRHTFARGTLFIRNGRIVPFDFRLKNGDIVEVVTSQSAHGPSRDWVKIARSSNARSKIRQWFKKEKRDENIANGRSAFDAELRHCGIAPRSATCRPRIHDLRHSFAVSTIADDYRTGTPGSRLAILSTYLGHADPGDTYWYLSAAPELLGLAGERLDRHLRGEA